MENFVYFANVIEIYLKRVCEVPLNIDIDVKPIPYPRPYTKTPSYSRWSELNDNKNDTLFRHIAIGHTVKNENVLDFVISPKGEICFYQLKLLYGSANYETKPGKYIIDTLIIISDLYRQFNEATGNMRNVICRMFMSYLESVEGYTLIGG